MLLYANWSADVPVFARSVLPVATTEDEFDAEGYIKMGERWLPRDHSHDRTNILFL